MPGSEKARSTQEGMISVFRMQLLGLMRLRWTDFLFTFSFRSFRPTLFPKSDASFSKFCSQKRSASGRENLVSTPFEKLAAENSGISGRTRYFRSIRKPSFRNHIIFNRNSSIHEFIQEDFIWAPDLQNDPVWSLFWSPWQLFSEKWICVDRQSAVVGIYPLPRRFTATCEHGSGVHETKRFENCCCGWTSPRGIYRRISGARRVFRLSTGPLAIQDGPLSWIRIWKVERIPSRTSSPVCFSYFFTKPKKSQAQWKKSGDLSMRNFGKARVGSWAPWLWKTLHSSFAPVGDSSHYTQ